MVLKGPFSIINGLLMLWVIHSAYATMHFCQTLFMAIFFFMDFITAFFYALAYTTTSPFVAIFLWLLTAYTGLGTYWSWTAFNLFRQKFDRAQGFNADEERAVPMFNRGA